MMSLRRSLIVLAAAALAACQPAMLAPVRSTALPAEAGAAGCAGETAALDSDFVTGAFAACKFIAADHVVVQIRPEDAPPINCSPWYAMRIVPSVASSRAASLTLDLSYDACGHRYWPKTSSDGLKWTPMPESAVVITEVDGIKQARLTMPLGDKPLFLAAQEIAGPAEYAAWFDEIFDPRTTSIWQFGTSAEGRPIPAMTIVADGAAPREQVLLIGRQHPPEVTGYLALQSFVETILTDTPLSASFRQRFQVTLVPMLNPDGVVRGNWRHNIGHLDLNRDWGPFTQPETQQMDAFLQAMDADPDRQLRLFLDFHSTGSDVFYTIPDDQPTDPAMFISNWLGSLQQRMPDYAVNRDSNHNPDSATSKSLVFRTYGVPTTTFELGDETDRTLIARIGREAATAMMEQLLEAPLP